MLRARSIPFPILVAFMSVIVFASVMTFTSNRQPQALSALEGIKADVASPTPTAPLTTEQMSELFKGSAQFINRDYAEAAPILGKYALMGNARAQSAIGVMYYSGLGVKVDRAEAIKWLRLSAAQGDEPGRLFLAEVTSAAMALQRPDKQPADVEVSAAPRAGGVQSEQVEFGTPRRAEISPSDSQSSIRDSLAAAMQPITPGPASREDIPYRRHVTPPTTIPPIPRLDFGDALVLNRAGPGSYSDAQGNSYTQAGPHGVINNRTGQFSPTN